MIDKSVVFIYATPPDKHPKMTLPVFNPELKNFDVVFLCETKKEKVLKKDITLNIEDVVSRYDIVVPVGAESLKHVCKLTNVTKYNGLQVDGKFFPLINPNMVIIKPQAQPIIAKAIRNIVLAQKGELKVIKNDKDYRHITTQEQFDEIFVILEESTEFVIDTETTGLNYLTDKILSVIFSTKIHEGFYVDMEVIKNNNDRLKELVKRKKIIFHNAKFDIHMLRENFGWEFNEFEDTMLLHYCLNEAVGTHGLKQLAIEFTDLGDYETPLDTFKKEFCRKNKILLGDFNYGLIPTEILSEYGMKDGDASMQLYRKFKPLVEGKAELNNVYTNILLRAVQNLVKLEKNGGPIDIIFLNGLQSKYETEIARVMLEIKQYAAVKEFEKLYEKDFNPGSVKQLGIVLFEILKLPPVKLTDTGNFSTDVEVLKELQDMNPFPKLILELRKMTKLKSTYIDSILEVIDTDGRLRSNFNLQGTTSGRLSSSGNINYQNLPRDKGPGTIKSAFKAREGYVIVQADLKTAEVYVASVLSKDKFLQQAFIDKVDFHSYIAKQIFSLPCTVEEVPKLFKDHRQWAKAITFGIMYQAGAPTIAETAKVTKQEAQDFINKYFNEAKELKKFIEKCNLQIENYQFIYSAFGRKRRLMEALSSSRGVKYHAIRSGVNFVVQSVASDINLLVLCDVMEWIDETKQHDTIIPFTIVHDSIVAEVRIDKVKDFICKIDEFVKQDRGISIPGCPITMEYEMGPNWGELINISTNITVNEITDILVNKKYAEK